MHPYLAHDFTIVAGFMIKEEVNCFKDEKTSPSSKKRPNQRYLKQYSVKVKLRWRENRFFTRSHIARRVVNTKRGFSLSIMHFTMQSQRI